MTQKLTINDIEITVNANQPMSEKEIVGYIDYVHEGCNRGDKIKSLDITIDPKDPENAILDYRISPVQFQRVRRITGYLVGTLDKWNGAKRQEEHDRVKHGLNFDKKVA